MNTITIKRNKILTLFIPLIIIFLLASCQMAPSEGNQLDQESTNEISEGAILPPIFGIEDNRITVNIGRPYYEQINVHWWRKNGVIWSSVEPNEGERNWNTMATLEEDLKEIAAMGANPILIVRSTPSWAQKVPGAFCGPIQSEKIRAFGNFMYDLVSRYSGPPYNVKHWELWNEPDIDPSWVDPKSVFGCWGNQEEEYFGGKYYAEMLSAVYPRIKEADPEAQILVGGLLLDCDPRTPPEDPPGSGNPKDCSPALFLEGILANQGGDFFDGISFHAYDFYAGGEGLYGNLNWNATSKTTGPVFKAKTNYLKEVLSTYGISGKFLMNTEQALLCIPGEDESYCQTEEFQRAKAAYVIQSYAAAIGSGLTANIWFSLTGWRNSGLVDQTLQPLPAFQAYQFISTVLNESQFITDITLYPGVEGYGFQRGESAVWVLWSLDGTPQSVQLPQPPTSILKMTGDSLPLSQEINVSLSPMIVVWEGS